MSNHIRTAVLIISLIMFAGCGDKIKSGDETTERPLVKDITTVKVLPVEMTEFLEVPGTVRSVNTSVVSSKIMGEVKDIKVKVSDKVRTGDVLLTINSPETEARVRASEEAVEEAKKAVSMAEANKILMQKTFARYERLYAEKAVSEQEFDEIRARHNVVGLEYERSQKSLKKSQAALREAEAFRDYATVRSPVNGIVADKKIDTGSMTAPGMPLMIIEQRKYRIEIAVDEGMVGSITVEMPVEILIESAGIKTEGKVGEIVKHVDPDTRTFIVKVDLKETSDLLQGGLYARARFPVEKRTKMFINNSSLIKRGELRGVYAVDDKGIVTFRIVKTGKDRDGKVEILSGLNAGESIIVDGIDKAVDGGRIR